MYVVIYWIFVVYLLHFIFFILKKNQIRERGYFTVGPVFIRIPHPFPFRKNNQWTPEVTCLLWSVWGIRGMHVRYLGSRFAPFEGCWESGAIPGSIPSCVCNRTSFLGMGFGGRWRGYQRFVVKLLPTLPYLPYPGYLGPWWLNLSQANIITIILRLFGGWYTARVLPLVYYSKRPSPCTSIE